MSAYAGTNKNCVLVHERQRPNARILSQIRNVPFEFVPAAKGGLPADFVPNATTAILILSFKHHLFHPNYIVKEMKRFPKPSIYKLKIVLLYVDMPIPTAPVDIQTGAGDSSTLITKGACNSNIGAAFIELNNTCFQHEFTLLCAYSELECARYIETFKAYETKSIASIQEKQEVDFLPQVTKFLTSNIPGLNKTDVITLLETYGDVATLSRQSEHDLLLIPGIGDTKAKRIYKMFHTLFIAGKTVAKSADTDKTAVCASSSSCTIDPAAA